MQAENKPERVTGAVFLTDNPVVALSLIWVIGGAPLILVIIASAAAGANGCGLDEAGAYPCIILGRDFGRILATMSVLGWAGPVTISIAIGLLLLRGSRQYFLSPERGEPSKGKENSESRGKAGRAS
ncbi:hypothetical protein ACX83E_00025 [Burkholderia pseudomallei]